MSKLKTILMGTVAALGIQSAEARAGHDSLPPDAHVDHFVCIEDDLESGKLRAVFRVAENHEENMPPVGYKGPKGTVISELTYASTLEQVISLKNFGNDPLHSDDVNTLQIRQFEIARQALDAGINSCDYAS